MKDFGPITMVSAGAGTGKTYRLTSEYLEAVKAGTAPTRIIATTFTNKAAAELLERLRERLLEEGRPHDAQLALAGMIGTVNSVCGRLVSDYALDLGLSPVADVLPPELVDAFFATAAEPAVAEWADTLEPVAERLSLQQEWKGLVRELIDKARANGIDASRLPDCGRRSWESLRPLLISKDEEVTADDLDRRLADAVRAAIAGIAAAGDQTDKTARVLTILQSTAGTLAAGRTLTWIDWARLAKLDPGAGSRAPCDPVKAVAARHPAHPRLHQDLKSFITGIFACAAAAMDHFAAFKQERGLLDFVDQEHLLLAMLENRESVVRLRERFSLVMVDEFQDTSPIQLSVFLGLARAIPRSVWVGDRKQAIYGFRGTDPALVDAVIGALDAASGDTEEVLDESRRSRPELVRFANAVFTAAFPPKGIPADKVKINRVHRQDGPGMGPALHHWPLEGKNWTQAVAALADGITALLAEPDKHPVGIKDSDATRPLRPGDIAVLCRQNDRCKAVADALATHGIRAAIPRDGLFDTPEARAAVAALRYLADPADTLAVAEIGALAGLDWLDRLLSQSIKAVKAELPGLAALDATRERLAQLTPSEALETAIAVAGIDRLVRGWGDGAERLANLDALRALAARYEDTCRALRGAATAAGLVGFLETEVKDGGGRPAVEDEGAVRVLTYHRAKGLEWPVVVMLDVETGARGNPFGVYAQAPDSGFDPARPLEGRWLRFWPWPYGEQKTGVHLDTTAAASPEAARQLEAEHAELVRLAYVGVTRARDTLIVASRINGRSGAAWLNILTDADGLPILSLPSGAGETAVDIAGESFIIAVAPQTAPDQDPTPEEEDAIAWHAPPPAPEPRPDYPPSRLAPSAAEAGEEATPMGDPISLGGRLPLSGSGDMALIGEAVHAFLAADDPFAEEEARRSTARAILARWGVGQLTPDTLLEASRRLLNFVIKRYGTATMLREMPVTGRIGDQIAEGRIDLLVDTPEGFVIIDHKSFPGPVDRWPEKARSYRPQLDLYRRLVEQATGRKVRECYVHLPIGGAMVEVSGTCDVVDQ